MQTVQIVAPIFFIILAGYLGQRFGLVKGGWVRLLNSFVYYVSLPALIMVSFWSIDWQEDGLGYVLMWNFLFMLAFALLAYFVLEHTDLSRRMKASVFMSVILGNTVYMGFPLVGRAVAPENYGVVVGVATLQLVLGLFFSVLAIEFWVLKSRSFKIYLDDLIKNPLVISLIIGFALGLLYWRVEAVGTLKSSLAMLGATASPLALFALGAFMHGKLIKENKVLLWAVSLIKMAVLPVMFLLISRFFNPPAQSMEISLLLFAMPVAVTSFVLSEKYNLEKHFNAGVIVLSTALAIVILPVFLVLFL